ncbi:DnaB-like helicase N-terminal domain-containing protein [Nonomuraea sp. SYSU D8015]|uniref:DnaB-like helicase N-terminal domain-containing protein n=1 Tax=Nonomuraea sp. SYSU D8015 TaxID=2593644 RepID=UPI0016603F49|nr:DnaB-like helicase N-terminal domain-containing protein [Nonomuraea sp. SYSU D8015]
MTPDEYAERALLGSLLRDPRQIRDVEQLAGLRAVDFGLAAHRMLYHALIEAAKNNDLNTIDGWNAFHTTILQHATQTGHDRRWLEQLAASTQAPDQALRYALMVMEGDHRRAIITHAQRIAAEFAGATPQRLAQTQQQIDQMRETLHNLAQRWQQLGPPGPGEAEEAHAAAPPSGERQHQAEDSTATTSQARSRLTDMLPNWMRRPARASESEQRELQLLASLVQDPQQLVETQWLRPEDFTTPHAAAFYEALLALTTRAEPIDAITVLYEAHRHQPIDGAAADRFITACKEEAPAAVILAREVIEPALVAAVNTHVEQLIDEVTRGRADEALGTAITALTQIEATVSRYTTSRQITAGDTHVYTPPDPGPTPATPQQRTAPASAAP